MSPGRYLSAVVGKQELRVEDVEQFLTIARNLVRKLTILKLVTTEPVDLES